MNRAPAVALHRRLPLLGSLAASGFSALGNAVAMVALPWFVLHLSGSTALTGLAAAASTLPVFAGTLLCGGWVDRYGPRRVAVFGDLVSALCVASVPVLHLLGVLSMPVLLALIAAGALFDSPTHIATQSRRPEIARRAGMSLDRAASLDDLLKSGALLAGPVVAGLAIAVFGLHSALYLTAGCSLLAAVLDALSLPGPRRRPPVAAPGLRSTFEGVRFVLRDPLLRVLVTMATVFVAVFGAMESVIMPAHYRAEGSGAMALGSFLSAAGGGAAAGALGYALWGYRLSRRAVFLGGCCLFSLAVGLIAFAPTQPLRIAGGLIAGLAAGPLGPIEAAAILRRVPIDLRSRALGAMAALSLAILPAASALAGVALETIAVRELLAGCAIVLAALTATALLLPGLKALDRDTTARTGAPDAPAATLRHDG